MSSIKSFFVLLALMFASTTFAKGVCPNFLAGILFKAAWPTAHFTECELREVIPDPVTKGQSIYALRLKGESARSLVSDKELWFEPHVVVRGGSIIEVRVGKYKSHIVKPFTLTKQALEALRYKVVYADH